MIKVVPLGAGQDVGRSCILLTICNKNIMLDCGMHMGYNDHRRFPDFKYISNAGDFNDIIDAIIISHFHLDHCGALPYFTEICGFDGPIYMTHPTKSIAPILLEDMRKVCVERKAEQNFFTSADIKNCMRKVISVDLNEIIKVDEQIEIKAYYAGHVLGAAMFHIRVHDYLGTSQSVVYTGDYNMTPDRHLGSAWIDECKPDLLITESTYATTVRESKRARERDFLQKVHEAVAAGGKVLIPVFALGRAQELLILIESYWERMSDLHSIPVYFSAGLTERANEYYKLFISWTNEKIKETFVNHNMFNFSRINTWKSEYAEEPGPMVLFASPGMLHAGTSLSVFTKWCHDPLNMVIMPGYCVAGTVGAKVLAGEKSIAIDRFNTVQVNLQVKNLSFSAHADSKGILALIKMSGAKNVLLVHGERKKMADLKQVILQMGIPCFDPANGTTAIIETKPHIPALVSLDLVKSWINDSENGEIVVRGQAQILKHKLGQKLYIIDREDYKGKEELKVELIDSFVHSIEAIGKKLFISSLFDEIQELIPYAEFKDMCISIGKISVSILSDLKVKVSSPSILDPKEIEVLAVIKRLFYNKNASLF
jgi:integrator complex subunit 11